MKGSRPRPRPRRLSADLLVCLGGLAAGAILLVGALTLALARDAEPRGIVSFPLLWLAAIVVTLALGGYIARRLILRPLAEVLDTAAAVAGGELAGQAQPARSAEFAELSERLRALATQMLDAQTHATHVEKLAVLGRLSAGVAHEIRNPLGAIGNYTEVLRQRGGEPEITKALAREIARIDRIVEGLLDYARPSSRPHAADLNSVVREAVDLLQEQGKLQPDEVRLSLDTSAPIVAGDPHALGQVVVNLLLNARDAAPGRPVHLGTLEKTMQPRHQADREPRRDDPDDFETPARRSLRRPWRTDVPAGTRGSLLYVADEGPGVREEDRERVFDPFYTTKVPGHGTGLGLAIVARTVQDAGGVIWVDRAREGGAVFKVFLPERGREHATADR